MPNAHGEPSAVIFCGLPAGHDPPHVCATDYVRHTWEPPGPALAPPPSPKPPPKAAVEKSPRPPKPKPARRARPRRRRRRNPAWPAPVREVVRPLFGIGLAGAAVHVLALTLPHLAR